METSSPPLLDLLAELSRACADGVAGLPADDLLRMLADAGTLQRALDAIRVRLAGELAAQSAAHLGADGIARRAGHPSPASFLAELWQISPAEAARLCEVGVAVRSRTALDGSALPARYPTVGAAVESLALGVDAAAVIVRELDQAAPYCSPDARAAGERLLVEHAPGLTMRQVQGLARQVRDRLDEDGAEPRDQIRRQRRSLTLIPQPDGMVRLVWDMPPETAGLVRAGIDALVGEQLRAARDRVAESLGTDGIADADNRTMPQRRADAAEELFRHAISCDRPGGDRPVVTMVVRMTLDQLLDGPDGLGGARIDGVDAGISATTARLLAADANIIPTVLGGAGEVLDLGRARRLFSPAQGKHWPNGTAGVRSRGVGTHPATPKPTTSNGGPAADPPTSATACHCARSTTTASMTTGGRFRCGIGCRTSSHHPGATRIRCREEEAMWQHW